MKTVPIARTKVANTGSTGSADLPGQVRFAVLHRLLKLLDDVVKAVQGVTGEGGFNGMRDYTHATSEQCNGAVRQERAQAAEVVAVHDVLIPARHVTTELLARDAALHFAQQRDLQDGL